MKPHSNPGNILALALTFFQTYQHLQKCPEENTLFNLANRESLSNTHSPATRTNVHFNA